MSKAKPVNRTKRNQGKKRGPEPHTIYDIWKNIEKRSADECWPFTGTARGIKGYGRVTIARKTYLPHRIAYVAEYGSIPEGMFILHKCNNPLCCNPNHLYAGTHQENMDDAKRNGKIGGPRPRSGRKPKDMNDRNINWYGMNWIRKEKRLAIYLRDGLACAYCGLSVEDGAKLTLDHLLPHSLGGKNEATNLVTCCLKCNSSRGNRDWREFAAAVAGYINHGVTAEMITDHIETTVSRKLDVKEAKAMIARRGGFTAAVNNC